MEKKLNEKDDEIKKLKQYSVNEIDKLEQYQRRSNLRVFGIPETVNENTDNLIVNLANEKLKVKLNISDIDRSHRVGRKGNKPRPIIVKFTSYRSRQEIFRSKAKLKGERITIREDLTKCRLEVLKKSIQQYGIQNVWTADGRINVRNGTQKFVIDSITDQ